jgi:hypothetical protein
MDTPELTDDDLDDEDPVMALWRLEGEARRMSEMPREDPELP